MKFPVKAFFPLFIFLILLFLCGASPGFYLGQSLQPLPPSTMELYVPCYYSTWTHQNLTDRPLSHLCDAESCYCSAVSVWEQRDREAACPRPHRKLLATQWAEPVSQVPEQQTHHRTTFLLHKILETIQIFKAKAYVQTWKLFKLVNATNVYQPCNSLLVQITSVKSKWLIQFCTRKLNKFLLQD